MIIKVMITGTGHNALWEKRGNKWIMVFESLRLACLLEALA